jgi:DNA-binding PadR family transcriptional regulator
MSAGLPHDDLFRAVEGFVNRLDNVCALKDLFGGPDVGNFHKQKTWPLLNCFSQRVGGIGLHPVVGLIHDFDLVILEGHKSKVIAFDDGSSSAGPERRIFQTTEEGRKQLADALEAPRWTNARVHQPFQTWLALSWQARPRAFAQQVRRRQKHLREKLAEERTTLEDVLKEVGHPYHEAAWMLKLIISQIELELNWLDQIERETPKRAPAKKRSGKK